VPTRLVTPSPPATRPGPLAQAGPEPSPGGVQGPLREPIAQAPAPRRSGGKPCPLDAVTGCSAASTAGPGRGGPPASPQPPPAARHRVWGGPGMPQGLGAAVLIAARTRSHAARRTQSHQHPHVHPRVPGTETPGTGTG